MIHLNDFATFEPSKLTKFGAGSLTRWLLLAGSASMPHRPIVQPYAYAYAYAYLDLDLDLASELRWRMRVFRAREGSELRWDKWVLEEASGVLACSATSVDTAQDEVRWVR